MCLSVIKLTKSTNKLTLERLIVACRSVYSHECLCPISLEKIPEKVKRVQRCNVTFVSAWVPPWRVEEVNQGIRGKTQANQMRWKWRHYSWNRQKAINIILFLLMVDTQLNVLFLLKWLTHCSSTFCSEATCVHQEKFDQFDRCIHPMSFKLPTIGGEEVMFYPLSDSLLIRFS